MGLELRSRLIFVDTNIYEGKNFQFLTHSLGALKSLIEDGEIHLLITDVTKGEVISHINKKVAAALTELKAIKKSSMILRNLPDMPAHGIFSDVNKDEMTATIVGAFETFLRSDHVEFVSIDGVKPSYVFERYFSVKAPFAEGDKEKEFADAFVLKALHDLSETRGYPIHVISNDKDMLRYSEDHPRLLCSSSIDEYIDAVNKSVSIEPSVFAATALEAVRGEVMNIIHEQLKEIEHEFKYGGWESELEDLEVFDIELITDSLLSVSDEECVYELGFRFKANSVEVEKDYDRSPFDHEDGRYAFVLDNVFERSFDGEVSLQVTISYQDKLLDSVEIRDYESPTNLKLSLPYDETVRYLDINGET